MRYNVSSHPKLEGDVQIRMSLMKYELGTATLGLEDAWAATDEAEVIREKARKSFCGIFASCRRVLSCNKGSQ